MNIIQIMSDEHSGSSMGFAGDRFALTPSLDRLAQRGVVFSNAYSTCPVCAPARASWFTGQYVCRMGTWDNSTPYDGEILGMAEHLAKHGVPMYHIGKTHFHYQGEYHFAGSDHLGFLQVPDVGCYYRDQHVARLGAEKRFQNVGIDERTDRFDDKVLESTLSWLDKNGKSDKPWVLNVGFIEPHFPFWIKSKDWEYFENLLKDVPLPDEMLPPYSPMNSTLADLRHYFCGGYATEEIMKKIRIGYYASIKELDDKIGMILSKLDELGLYDDTIVIYTCDHGEQLGYHGLWWKCCMYEQSARIPMMISAPGIAAREEKAAVSLTDLFPTICDAMSVPRPEKIDGQSIWGFVEKGEEPEHRDFAFSEFNAHGLAGGMYMIRWGKYKYVFYTEDEPQLFDMDQDPMENHDLVSEKKITPELEKVMEECKKRLYSVCDPFEVTKRSLDFQKRMKKELGLPEKYEIERGGNFVPHPDYAGMKR